MKGTTCHRQKEDWYKKRQTQELAGLELDGAGDDAKEGLKGVLVIGMLKTEMIGKKSLERHPRVKIDLIYVLIAETHGSSCPSLFSRSCSGQEMQPEKQAARFS